MSNQKTGIVGFFSQVIHRQYFWGIVAIVLLLAVNVAKDSSYLAITVNESNGNLVGNLIDILRAAAPIMMIAVGSTLR